MSENISTKELVDSILRNVKKKDKDFGRFGDFDTTDIPGWVSTGNFLLDCLCGGRGFPLGRIVEVLGVEGAGKSTLLLSTLAQAQKQGGLIFLIETEYALEKSRAEKLGLDLDKIGFAQKEVLEEVLEGVEAILESAPDDLDVPFVIAWDSIAATAPREEIEGSIGKRNMGLMARIMKQSFRGRLPSLISKKKALFLCSNQLTSSMDSTPGADPYQSIGGGSMKYHSSIRLRLFCGSKIKEKDEAGAKVIGQVISVKMIKNKIAPPFMDGKIRLIFDKGFVQEEESTFDYLKDQYKIVHKGGANYTLKLPSGDLGITKQNWPEVFAEKKEEIRNLIIAG